jgi:hypothetical protein
LTFAKSVNRGSPSRGLRELLPFRVTAPCVPPSRPPRDVTRVCSRAHVTRATTRRTTSLASPIADPRHVRCNWPAHVSGASVRRLTLPASCCSQPRAVHRSVRCTAACRAPARPALHTAGSRTQCITELGQDATALSVVSPTTTTTVPDHVRRQARSSWGHANFRPTDDRRARFLHRCARHRAVQAEKRQCFT